MGLVTKSNAAAVHCDPDIFHIPVRRNYYGTDIRIHLGDLLEQRKAVHLGHVDVGEHHIDAIVFIQPLERFYAVTGKNERVAAPANGASHTLQHERFDVGLVVHDQDLIWER